MLSDYVDGDLPEAERTALEEHLQGCASCTEELDSLRATVQLLQRMPEVEAPRSFRIAPAAVTAPTPPPERPVLLWAMRVSTALAVVAFTVMVAGNVTGLFEGGGDGEASAPTAFEARSDVESEPTAMMEEPTARPSRPTPEAMMEAEPDMPPRSTPMMMAEPTATAVPAGAMEPTAMPDEAMESPTATPQPQSDTSASGTSEDSLEYEITTPIPEPAPVATAMPEPTPAPALTATPRTRPTAFPTPSPMLMPRATPAPTMDFRTRPDPTPTPEPWAWASSEEKDDGGNGVVLGLTVGLGALAAALALGTIYLTVRRRRGVG